MGEFAEGARVVVGQEWEKGGQARLVWPREWLLQGQDRVGGFCLSGMMGKGVGRLLLHFC